MFGAKTEFGVAIVRNRVVYEVKDEEKVTIILYLQDNRINLDKLNEDIKQITYKNFVIILLHTKEIEKNKGYKDLIANNKIIQTIEIKKENIIREINQKIKESASTQMIIAKDIQDIKTKNFIEQLIGFMQRDANVGVISPRIIYKYQSSQYNGTVCGIDSEKIGYLDYIDVAGSFGYITRGAVVENYSIIKSECIMTSKANIEKVGYLSEKMDYPDALADLSFELFKHQNKLNIINPHIELETLEQTQKEKSNEFYKKWESDLKIPDPNYNINLKFEKNNLFKIKN